jgi:hypothetical protein
MLRLLKRWLGWEDDDDYFGSEDLRARVRPRSATAQVLAKGPRKEIAQRMPRAAPRAAAKAAPGTASKPAPKRTGPQVLDFAEDAPDPAFDPYNTGKFDRSASWDRISKNQR